jgi:hypothetical protein
MKLSNRPFISWRVFLSILAGVAASILFISYIRNYILATVLGLLVGVWIADLPQPRDSALLGLVTGALTGLYLGWRNAPVPAGIFPGSPLLATSLLGWLVLTGLVCTVYGFVAGKFIQLYRKGQGPFF